jgi:hypothetical protein
VPLTKAVVVAKAVPPVAAEYQSIEAPDAVKLAITGAAEAQND